jgi:hypothetical protein
MMIVTKTSYNPHFAHASETKQTKILIQVQIQIQKHFHLACVVVKVKPMFLCKTEKYKNYGSKLKS